MKTKLIRALLAGIMAVSVVAMSGCALSIPGLRTDSQKEDDDEDEDDDKDKDDKGSKKDTDDEEEGIGVLKKEALAYFGTTYGDHLGNGGDEAELLHAGRYTAECTDLDAYVVFEAKWDDDSVDYTVDDDMSFIRLEGDLSAFFTGEVEEMKADEFIKALEENYAVTYEFMQSGGTAYYVSADEYLHIELADKEDDSLIAVLEIACGENDKISSSSFCWLMEESEGDLSFSDIPSCFTFSSGAGGWSTDIEISEDGSFSGMFLDSDMGDTGNGYSNGTVYICNFSGRFSEPEATDDPFIYSMKLLELNVDDDAEVNSEEIIDDVRYVYSTPYGFEDADEFLLYLPGASLSDMTEACRSWIHIDEHFFREVPEGYYVLYNVGGEEGFTAEDPGNVWCRTWRYYYNDAYIQFTTSFYMGSYLNFFENDYAPSSLPLEMYWDGKSTDPIECDISSWGIDDGSVFEATVERLDGDAPDELDLRITVKCLTDPEYDFSTWGSNVPGEFEGILHEVKD